MTVLCVDFGGSVIKVGVAEAACLGAHGAHPVTGSRADLELVERTARELGADDVRRVAIAVPGLVDPHGPRMVAAHGKYAWMLGADLGAWARDAFGADVVVENDARAALIGETSAGAAAGERDAVILVLGTGIGTAAMTDGQPSRGPDGSAGILGGHLTIDRGGPACNCGNLGCAEVYGSTWALPDRIRERFGESGRAGATDEFWHERLDDGRLVGFADLFARTDDDGLARAVLDDAIDAWGVTAVSMCHAYDPRTVIIAGGVARAADRILPAIERMIDERIWGTLPRPRVVASAEPELSVLRGLAVIGNEEEPA